MKDVNDEERRKATAKSEDKKAFCFVGGELGKNTKVKTPKRAAATTTVADWLGRSVGRCSRGLSLLNGLVRCPFAGNRHAHGSLELFVCYSTQILFQLKRLFVELYGAR